MMKKFLKIQIIGFFLLALAFASCNTAEQEVSPIVNPDGYPQVTFTIDNPGTEFSEGDTIWYTVTTDKWLDRALTFSVRIIEGTATDDDFEVKTGVIAPYSNTARVMVVINKDYAPDPGETVKFEIGLFGIADRYLVDPATVNPTQSFSIVNYESDVLEMAFDWRKDILVDPGYEDFPDYRQKFSTASHFDLDFAIADAVGYDALDPWATGLGYLAATSACPETGGLAGGDLPDGDYIIFSELWKNDFVDTTEFYEPQVVEHADVPVTAYFIQQGVMDEISFIQEDPSIIMDTELPGADNFTYNGELINFFVAGLKIQAGTYSISDFEGNVLKTGKFKGETLKLKVSDKISIKKNK